MTGTPFISMVICSRNRAADLAQMLESVTQLNVPADLDWELVVVDNGSTDATPQIIEGFAPRLPIVAAHEPKAGLSNARNRGAEVARGEYICWTDDDVRLDPDWLAAYARVFRAHPDGAYFGGRIRPVFEGEMPAWLTDNLDKLGSAFAKRELGNEVRRFTDAPGDSPFGANFAIRAAEQKQHLYADYLGVSPQFKRVGEESEVVRILKEEGKPGYWVADAVVNHMIPEKRQSLEYIVSYQQALGETRVLLSLLNGENFMGVPIAESKRLFRGVPLWIWRKMAVAWLRFRLGQLVQSSRGWIPALMEYGYYRGALSYLMQKGRA